MSERNYWNRLNRQRLSRRSMLSASAKAGVGAAGLALVGCGDDDDDDDDAVAPGPAPDADDQVADDTTDDAADQADDQDTPADDTDDADDQAVATGPVSGGSIRTYDNGDIASFDGFLTFGYRAFLHGKQTYPMLEKFGVGPDLGPLAFPPVLEMASSYELVDSLTHTYAIKDNANWEDVDPTNGRPVTGEDVAFAFTGDRYDGYPNAGILKNHIDGMDTPDDKTITFNLNKPVAPFRLYQGHHAGPYTMPPEAVAAETTRQNMISAGPFKLGSYNAGASVNYVRNDEYHGEKTLVDDVEVVFLADDSAIQAAIRTGEIQLGIRTIPNTIALDLKEDLPDANWTTFGSNVIGGVFFDLSIWTDPRARQALNNAFDRDGYLAVTDSYQKGGVWGSLSLPALPPFAIDSEPADSPLHEFFKLDLQRARQLLDAAGVEEGFDAGSIAIPAANTYGPTFTEQGLLVQANLAAAGLELAVEIRDSTEHYSTTFRGTGNDGGFGITSSVQGIEADELFVNMYRGDSPRSPIINGELMFDDQRLTDLIDAQLAAPTVEERTEVIADLQLHLAEQMYMLPLPYLAFSLYAAPELITKGPMKASFTGTETMATVGFASV